MIENTDVLWFFENHARMIAFDQWRQKTNTIAARELREEIERLAVAAISTIEREPTDNFRAVEAYVDGGESGVFWTLDGLYEEKMDVGMWVEVWLPANNVDWLGSEKSDYTPRIGLYVYAGDTRNGREEAKKWRQNARKMIAHAPRGAHTFVEDENGYYCVFERALFDELHAPEKIGDRLTPILSEFTRDVLPALRAAREQIPSFVRQLSARAKTRIKRP